MTCLFLNRVGPFAIALAALFIFPVASHAQHAHAPSPVTNAVYPPDENDYNVWNNTKDTEAKIKMGQEFVTQYPSSQHCEQIYDELVSAYYTKKDWNDLYATGDKAISRLPNDIYILVTVGWALPHQYHPDDPDAGSKLEKAEAYEKHAMDMIGTMPKPSKYTDEQFAISKTQLIAQAHSGLGLVYFRNQDYDNAVKELEQATQTTESPDAADVYALAFSLEQLNRFSEAADAFQKCSMTPGPLQERCKQSAAEDRTEASAPSK